MRDLDDRNDLDATVKRKICDFCSNAAIVVLTRTAERDSAQISITKAGILERHTVSHSIREARRFRSHGQWRSDVHLS